MSLFLKHLAEHSFLQYAVIASILASISCGIVGSYVAVKRISYIAGSIAHCTLAGMGVAMYLNRVYEITWATPLMGATVAALIAAVIIGAVTIGGRQRIDTVLSAVWSVGMAIGIIFIFRTPGYNENLMSYLFGNILMVAREDLWLMGGLNAIILVLTLLFYNKLLAVCFDEEYARLRGIRVSTYYMVLLLLTALTVVLLVKVVGIVMVIALLTLPTASAAQFTSRLWQMMLASVVLSMLLTVGGIAISYEPDVPAGATIILLAGVVYLLIATGAAIKRKFKKSV